MSVPSTWNKRAHDQWIAGKKSAAVQTVLAAINVKPSPAPLHLGKQLAYYVSLLGDWATAAAFLRNVCKDHPGDFEALLNLGVCLARSDNNAQAVEALESAVKLDGGSPVAWDGLASAYFRCQRYPEAKAAGERALLLKNEIAGKAKTKWSPPAGLPSEFARRKNKTNVISFSLWGDNPRYLRGALQNAILAAEVYPGWRCRFYIDESVPADFQQALGELGAERVLERDARKLSGGKRLARRFFVANDQDVGYFIVRDCDSVIGQREAGAVGAWQESAQWFHVMRDWGTHTGLMLAGMWGGVAGVLPDLERLFDGYGSRHLETPNWDQWFLRDCVWSLVAEHCLAHDRCFDVLGSRPFPDPSPEGNRHVGQDEFAVRREAQEAFLAEWTDRLPCLRLKR